MTKKGVHIYRVVVALLTICTIASVTGCAVSGNSYTDVVLTSSYRDIPGISPEDITAIEALETTKSQLVLGYVSDAETHKLPDSTLSGFAAKLSALLTELFGIEFVAEGYSRDELYAGIDSGLIDFTCDLIPADSYYASYPFAGRTLRLYTRGDAAPLKSVSDFRNMTVGFYDGSVADAVLKLYPGLRFRSVRICGASEAAAWLTSGELDAYVNDGFAELLFDEFDAISARDFFLMEKSPVAMVTVSPELAPVINGLNKYIEAGGAASLSNLYEDGEREYQRYRLKLELTEDEQAYLSRLAESGSRVSVALDYDNYPISYFNPDKYEYQGIAPDILREISRLTGIVFETSGSGNVSLDEMIAALVDGRVSMAASLPYSYRLEDQLLWIDAPYATAHYALLSKTGYPYVTAVQIINASVGFVGNSNFRDIYSLWFPGADNLTYYDSWDAAMLALENDEIDLLMSTDYELYAQINYNKMPGYTVNLPLGMPIESVFGFNKNEALLCSIIGKAQGYVRTDAIENSWTSRTLDFTIQYNNERTTFLVLFTIILLFALISVAYLSRKNKRIAMDYETQAVKLSTIFSAIPDMIYSKDTSFRYTSCNPSFEKLAGMKESEIIGKNADEIFAAYPDMAKSFAEVDERLLHNGKTQLLEDWYTFPDGSRRLFEAIKTPLTQNGVMVGMLGISRDITEHKKAEEDAHAASRAKSAFLAHMSHEIRTPMNAISGMTELIMREDMPASIYEYVVDIRHACANMLSLINDILDFSKIEAGSLEIFSEEYSLASLINDVLIIVRMKVSEKPIIFTANIDSHIPDTLIGDETRFRQILLNVLGNAAKYTNEGFVSLTITGKMEGDMVVLSVDVSDSGVGIREDDLNKLFGDFVRFDSIVNKSNPGTGLGLAIVRSLCKAMDGDISVVSEYGIGSTFSITLPQKVGAFDKSFAKVIDPQNKSVLLFKKRSLYAASIVRSLENLGVKCTLVTNSVDFRDELKKGTYAFVFSSCMLSESVSRAIEELCPKTKLILLLDFGEVPAMRNVRTIIMPAHTSSIANVLNDVDDSMFYTESGMTNMRFIAPAASVLVVDDVQTNLKVTQGLLLPYQIHVDICSSGAEAIELVKQKQYDIIFMDHMMPIMDGIEATEHIRSLERGDGYYKNLPIIALTANAVSGAKERLLENGMDDFLTKPIDMSKLNSLLEKWIPSEKKEKYRYTTVKHPTEEMNNVELTIDGIDVIAGLFTTGGSLDNYLKMLAVFHMDGTDKIGKIRDCVESDDIKLYTIFVHALKSASLSVGAVDISSFAKTLEMAGSRGDSGFIRENTERFLTELESLLKNIQEVIGQHRTESGVEHSPEFIRGELEKLAKALSEMDAGEVDDVMAALEPVRWEGRAHDVFVQISKHIYMFEYDSAAKLIDEMIGVV